MWMWSPFFSRFVHRISWSGSEFHSRRTTMSGLTCKTTRPIWRPNTAHCGESAEALVRPIAHARGRFEQKRTACSKCPESFLFESRWETMHSSLKMKNMRRTRTWSDQRQERQRSFVYRGPRATQRGSTNETTHQCSQAPREGAHCLEST